MKKPLSALPFMELIYIKFGLLDDVFSNRPAPQQRCQRVVKAARPTKSKSYLSEAIRSRIVQAREDGFTCEAIAKRFECNKATVSRICRRFAEKGSWSVLAKSGRKRITSPTTDRAILIAAKKNPLATSNMIQKDLNLKCVSKSTIRRRITETGEFGNYWQSMKPYLREANRINRLKWAKAHLNWTVEDWKRVIWSDESPFVLRYNRAQRVWRRHNDRYNPLYCRRTIKHDKKIMVWGCFTSHGVGKLYKVKGILEQTQYKQMLIHQLIPSAKKLFPHKKWILQQDNDPKHTAKSVQAYIKRKKIDLMDWPAQSPDLNPIENLWSILDQRLKTRAPKNEEELFKTLQDGWNNLEPQLLLRLVESMPRRCQAVIDANGNPTKY